MFCASCLPEYCETIFHVVSGLEVHLFSYFCCNLNLQPRCFYISCELVHRLRYYHPAKDINNHIVDIYTFHGKKTLGNGQSPWPNHSTTSSIFTERTRNRAGKWERRRRAGKELAQKSSPFIHIQLHVKPVKSPSKKSILGQQEVKELGI